VRGAGRMQNKLNLPVRGNFSMPTLLFTFQYLYRILTTRTDSQYSCPHSEFTGNMAVLRYCWFSSVPLWHQLINLRELIGTTVLNSKVDFTGRTLILRYNTKRPKILNTVILDYIKIINEQVIIQIRTPQNHDFRPMKVL
jgi:hypothetical protein